MTVTREHMEQTAAALRRNNMDAYCVDTKEEAVATLKSLLKTGDSVGVGGSRTLDELGVIDLLRGGDYRFIDRYEPGLTPEQLREKYVAALGADVFLCSSNAVTMNGELYNVDGLSNRVAALCYGPRLVVLVVGKNKIVPDLKAAEHRVKTIAAPLNSQRLHCDTYCRTQNACMQADGAYCTDGCQSPARICCTYVITAWQRVVGRIKVILVDENLGF